MVFIQITLPVMAMLIGLFTQAMIFAVMSLTHRNNTIFIFELNWKNKTCVNEGNTIA